MAIEHLVWTRKGDQKLKALGTRRDPYSFCLKGLPPRVRDVQAAVRRSKDVNSWEDMVREGWLQYMPWACHEDEENELVYWANRDTGDSSWEKPRQARRDSSAYFP